MLIKRSRDVPRVLVRAFDAFRANDPISMAEAFTLDARLSTSYDSDLAHAVGLQDVHGPVSASSAVGILRFYAYELSMFDVKDFEIVRLRHTDSGISAACQWAMRMRETGEDIVGVCHNLWTLDRTGRKIIRASSFCSVIGDDGSGRSH